MPSTYILPTPDDTQSLGADLARVCAMAREDISSCGLAVRMEGNLGAGKTCFVRAFLRELGFNGAVKSPTFTLVETYPVLGIELNHFDFYRFEDPLEFEDAGFSEMFGPGCICFTEWSERVGSLLPNSDITIHLEHSGAGRTAQMKGDSELGKKLLCALEQTRRN